MEKLEFRMLRADEIECRVGTLNDNGCSLLMYKDARVDMRLLDEVVGAMNWRRTHELINGNLFCSVEIYNEKINEWVRKQDVGVESNTEKEKGQASDAFKRACFNWGIGRELYTCPFVWVNLDASEVGVRKNGTKYVKTQFFVKTIDYKDGKVSDLVVVDNKGNVRYNMHGKVDKVSEDNAIGNACLEAAAAKTIDELRAIYESHPEFRNNSYFVGAVNKRKGELGA